ncbi:MAG TPA: hypothetical protein VK821_10475, partial [Dehalococcoidia bacterium]|nr:hypothetical protein [Dehalococcoidia bacterium]
MIGLSTYWTRKPVTRRGVLRGVSLAAGGLAAIGLAGCRGAATQQSSSPTSKSNTPLDPTKGKQGGKIVIQQYGDPGGGLELIKIRNPGTYQFAGFTHDGLLELRNGT